LGDEAFFEALTDTRTNAEAENMQNKALLPVYLFVGNEPIAHMDMLGLVCECCCPGGNWSTVPGLGEAVSGGLVIGGLAFKATLECDAAPAIITRISVWAVGAGMIAGAGGRVGIRGSVSGAPSCSDLYGGGGLRLYSFGYMKAGFTALYITIGHSGAYYSLVGIGAGVGMKLPLTTGGMYVNVIRLE